jgi:LSU ribosomal protein L4P
MKAQIRSIDGGVVEEVELPKVFDAEYRPDLIKKAVLAIQSTRFQPHGPNPFAGIRTSADGWGSGRGVSHVPRIKNGSRAARVPQARGGREAHPPVVEKVLIEKINKKGEEKGVRIRCCSDSLLFDSFARGSHL